MERGSLRERELEPCPLSHSRRKAKGVKKAVSKAQGMAPAKREKRFIDIAVKDSGISRKKLLQLGRSFEGTFSTTDVHCPAPTEDEYGR